MDEIYKGTKESDERLTPLLKSIGYVVTGWAALEHEVNKVIWSLASMTDEDGACITAQFSGFLPRMRALIALAHRNGADEKLLKDLNKFSALADGLARKRNRIVHDPWYIRSDLSNLGRLEITADKKLVFEIRPHDPIEITKIAHEITDAKKLFFGLKKRLSDRLRETLKSQIEEHHGKGSADFLDRPNQDSDLE